MKPKWKFDYTKKSEIDLSAAPITAPHVSNHAHKVFTLIDQLSTVSLHSSKLPAHTNLAGHDKTLEISPPRLFSK